MGLPRNGPKTSSLLIAAIRKLRNIHGSTSREIMNCVASECDSPKKNIQQQMKLALRRGLSTGILHRSKDGFYTCAAFDDSHSPGDRAKGRPGRRRSQHRKGRSRRRKGRSKRRGSKRKTRYGRRSRRGMKCAGRRNRKSCKSRRRRKYRGRRREDGVELDQLAGVKSVRKQRSTQPRNGTKSKNSSKSSSQTRMSSASSGKTRGSEADTESGTLSASGKESMTDHSDISGTSGGIEGETKQ